MKGFVVQLNTLRANRPSEQQILTGSVGRGAFFVSGENSSSVCYGQPTQATTHSLTRHILTLFIVRELV